MPTKKIAVPSVIYQIKVVLLDTEPPIWRQLLVPSSVTMAQLHQVLQIAMGWQDSHLHEFRVDNRRIGPPDPDDGFMEMESAEDESKVRLSEVIRGAGATAIYTYDFGDGWEHSITLEKVLPVDAAVVYPVCLDGQLAGPPEDCGGIPGFYDLLEALSDPKHEQHEEMREWLGGNFDPEAFSVDDVNRLFNPKARRRKASKS